MGAYIVRRLLQSIIVIIGGHHVDDLDGRGIGIPYRLEDRLHRSLLLHESVARASSKQLPRGVVRSMLLIDPSMPHLGQIL